MARIIKKGYTFDDVLLILSYSQILPTQTNTRVHLAKDVWLNSPIISAAMDTVTGSKLAIAIARTGGIGILHKNMSIKEQALEVKRVKRAEDGLILDPHTLTGEATVKDALELMDKYAIGGIPIVNSQNVPIGIITRKDVRFEKSEELLSVIIKGKKKLITGKKGISIKEAEKVLQKHKIERLVIIDDEGKLYGLITYHDSAKVKEHPFASKDKDGQLLVGAALGATDDLLKRAEALYQAGVDIFCLDSAHGHSKNVLEAVIKLKEKYPDIPLIAGNIVTAEAAISLATAGADVVKVGVGPGSICTTRITTGCGFPQLTAVMDVVEALKNSENFKHVSVIADGGIRYSGDFAKAMAAGATAIMAGSLFAGTAEAPGDEILFEGRKYKSYRGMGSVGAMSNGSKDRYFQSGMENKKLVPEGIEGMVPFSGTVADIIYQYIGGLKASMGYLGSENIDTFQRTANFVEITPAGMTESHPHGVRITKEAPNYSTAV